MSIRIHSLPLTAPGGLRHASASISGPQSYKMMKFEAGVHRVQRVPKTEKQGRIHTSTMTVAVLPQPTEVRLHSVAAVEFILVSRTQFLAGMTAVNTRTGYASPLKACISVEIG